MRLGYSSQYHLESVLKVLKNSSNFNHFNALQKKDFEYYFSLNVYILTLEIKTTYWITDFSSAKITLLKLRCKRHWKLLKSLHSPCKKIFIYLPQLWTVWLENLSKKGVSEMDIYILVNYETHQNSYIQYNKIIEDKAVSRRVLVSFVQKSVPRKLFSTFVTCIFYVKSK